MSLVKDDGCFVCGSGNPRGLGAYFTIDAGRRASSSRLVIPAWAQGWQGVVHGGLLSTLLDEACVHAGRTVGPQPVTAELTVRFRRPVPVETEVEVHGEVIEARRRVLQARARLEIAGEVYAEAEARVVLVRPSGVQDSASSAADGFC